MLQENGCTPKRLPRNSPQLNAFAERWVRTIKRECLDHFIAFGLRHLDLLMSTYVTHYHEERPHQGVGNRTLFTHGPPPSGGRVVCRKRLGGVLRHYERVAA